MLLMTQKSDTVAHIEAHCNELTRSYCPMMPSTPASIKITQMLGNLKTDGKKITQGLGNSNCAIFTVKVRKK